MSDFRLWSEINPELYKRLKPEFGIRSWDDLDSNDKHIIWKYLEYYFFDQTVQTKRGVLGEIEKEYYRFIGASDRQEKVKSRIFDSIALITNNYKTQNFAPYFLEDLKMNSACIDFANIFMNQQP